MRKILTILLTVLMVATLGTVNVFGDSIEPVIQDDENWGQNYPVSITYGQTITVPVGVSDSGMLNTAIENPKTSSSGYRSFYISNTGNDIDQNNHLSFNNVEISNINLNTVYFNNNGSFDLKAIKPGVEEVFLHQNDSTETYSNKKYWGMKLTVTVDKAKTNVSSEPAVFDNLFYSASGQQLIKTEASVSGLGVNPNEVLGTVYYNVTSNSGTTSTSGWTTNILDDSLKRTDAGKYYVEWLVASSDFYLGVDASGSGKEIKIENGVLESAGVESNKIEVKIHRATIWAEDCSSGFVFDGYTNTIDLDISKSQSNSGLVSGSVVSTNAEFDNISLSIENVSASGQASFSNSGVQGDIFSISESGKLEITNEAIPDTYYVDFKISASGAPANYSKNTNPSKYAFTMEVIIDKANIKDVDAYFYGDVDDETFPAGNGGNGVSHSGKYFYTGAAINPLTNLIVKIGDVELKGTYGYDYDANVNPASQNVNPTTSYNEIILKPRSSSKYIEYLNDDEEAIRYWKIVKSTVLKDYLKVVNTTPFAGQTYEVKNALYENELYKTSVSGYQYNGQEQNNNLVINTTLTDKDPLQITYYYKDATTGDWTESISGVPEFKDAGTYKIYYHAHTTSGNFDNLEGEITVVVDPVDLYLLPKYTEIPAHEYDPEYYASSNSGLDYELKALAYGYQWFDVEKDDDSLSGLENVSITIPEGMVTEVGAYIPSISGLSSVNILDNDDINNYFVAGKNFSVVTTFGDPAWGVYDNGYLVADGKTFVVKGDLSHSGTIVSTSGLVYDGKYHYPEPQVTVSTAKEGLNLFVPNTNYYNNVNYWGYKDANDYDYTIQAHAWPNAWNGWNNVYVTGSASGQFTIFRAPISVVWTDPDYTYAGQNTDENLPKASFSGLQEDIWGNEEKLTPYVVYTPLQFGNNIHDAGNAVATASLSGKDSTREVSWNDDDNARPINYIIVTGDLSYSLEPSVYSKVSQSGAEITYSSSRAYAMFKHYAIEQKELTVDWWTDDTKTTAYISGSGETYGGKNLDMVYSFPVASFSGLVDNETLDPSYYATKGYRTYWTLGSIQNVGDYNIFANIPMFSNVGKNYKLAGSNTTVYKIETLNVDPSSVTGREYTYNNLSDWTIYFKTPAPYASASGTFGWRVHVDWLDTNDTSKSGTVDQQYVDIQPGSTKFTISHDFVKNLTTNHKYKFTLVYDEPKNVADTVWYCTVYEYHAPHHDDEEEVVKPALKLVVNTAIEE